MIFIFTGPLAELRGLTGSVRRAVVGGAECRWVRVPAFHWAPPPQEQTHAQYREHAALHHAFPSLESSAASAHGRRFLEEVCNISFISRIVCGAPIPWLPESLKIVALLMFLFMRGSLKVTSRDFHSSL